MIDQLQYDYLANQLQSVDDQSTLDGGYADGASNTLELEYDNSGNLTRERNKGVNAVTYNHMNLPTRIELADSRAIEYIYNGSGARLRAEYYEGTEMVRKITYAGQFYYEDDALSQVFTETGRIVNDDNGRASGSPDGWDGVDYQYMLADHLGNARVVLSSIAERHVTVVATHEGERLTEEAMVFDNLELRDNSQQQYDHTQFNTNVSTSSPDYSYVKLDGQFDQGDERYNNIGTMAMLQVQGGDAIDIKAYAKYNSGGAKNNVGVDGIVSGLVNAFGFNPNSSESGIVLDLFEQANGALGALVAGTGNSDEPEAYLQYLFFDTDFNFVNTVDVGYAYDKVGSAAAVDPNSPVGDHEELHLTRTFTEDGYIFIFVSNSSTGIDVFFDDLTIDYTMNPIDQANDYYPFGGLMGSGFERIISKTNDFRYQGKEYDKDLQWYDFHARQYDPYLGRFLAADPMMQFSSPYNGMGNNPINLIDPTGMSARGTRLDGLAEEDDDQDDEVNAVSNGTTADEWERQKAAHYAQFINWLGGMNSTYGHSLHAANTYGMGNGSFGSAGHYQYAKNHGAQTVNYYNKNAVNNYNGAMVLPEMTSTTRKDAFNAPGQTNGTTQTANLGLDVPLGLYAIGSYAYGINENLRAISIAEKNVGMLRQLKNSIPLSLGHPTANDKKLAELITKNNKMLQGIKLGARRMVVVGTVIGLVDLANANPEDRTNKAAWLAADTAMGIVGLTGWGAPVAGVYFAGRFTYGLYEMATSSGN